SGEKCFSLNLESASVIQFGQWTSFFHKVAMHKRSSAACWLMQLTDSQFRFIPNAYKKRTKTQRLLTLISIFCKTRFSVASAPFSIKKGTSWMFSDFAIKILQHVGIPNRQNYGHSAIPPRPNRRCIQWL